MVLQKGGGGSIPYSDDNQDNKNQLHTHTHTHSHPLTHTHTIDTRRDQVAWRGGAW